MTAEEYFAIAIPTNNDFKTWTKSFFTRVDKAIKRSEKYLSKTTKED
jgi:hypothetical protein